MLCIVHTYMHTYIRIILRTSAATRKCGTNQFGIPPFFNVERLLATARNVLAIDGSPTRRVLLKPAAYPIFAKKHRNERNPQRIA